MLWLECSIETRSMEGGLAAEAVTASLMDAGIMGVETVDDYETRLFLEHNKDFWDYADDALLSARPGAAFLRFYVPAPGEEELSLVREGLARLKASELAPVLGSLELTIKTVDDADWETNWMQYYKPFRVGERLVIRPEWEPYDERPGDVVITLNPGQVFGTGLHQTTRMCLIALEKYAKPGLSALDAGCGSGILSLALLALSPGSRVTAIDTDKNAAKVVYANAALNSVDPARLRVLTGNILTDEALRSEVFGQYGLITANIVADVVARLTPIAAEMLAPGGLYISSGIIKARLPEILDGIKAQGLRVLETLEDGEWHAVVASK